jgi:hypothetical protein
MYEYFGIFLEGMDQVSSLPTGSLFLVSNYYFLGWEVNPLSFFFTIDFFFLSFLK